MRYEPGMSGTAGLLWNAWAVSGAAVTLLMLGGWLWSLARRDASVVDTLWGPGFALVAAASSTAGFGARPRQILVLSLVALWSARLAAHIWIRNRDKGEDYRYRAMRDRHGARFPWVSLFTVFAFQGLLMLFIAQPLVVATTAPEPRALGAWDFAGALLFLAGFLFEAIGDEQLRRFKADPANQGKVMDRGLWRYSRHPNYFGDATLWWGFFLIACAVPGGAWSFTGPLLMTFFLLKVSGVALLEKGLTRTKPQYADYVARTSAFVPWIPKAATRVSR